MFTVRLFIWVFDYGRMQRIVNSVNLLDSGISRLIGWNESLPSIILYFLGGPCEPLLAYTWLHDGWEKIIFCDFTGTAGHTYIWYVRKYPTLVTKVLVNKSLFYSKATRS